jgi:tetratricopeptide (TPR) repeat protein
MTSRVCLILFLFSHCALAQFDAASHRLRVRIMFANGDCDASTLVKLSARSGQASEAVPNDRCEVEFMVPDGTYGLHVSGRSFVVHDSVISTSPGSTDVEVKVTPRDDSMHMASMALSPSVSLADLRVPPKAHKELEKASKQIGQKDFTKAIRTLQHAIDLYPTYADAYNNLGTIYAHMGDREREREALEKAISLNDHLAPAYANLGRLGLVTGDFEAAERALQKASSCDPLDGITLLLLAYAQFMQKNIDAAIETSRQAHALRSTHAFVHQIAARAFEQKRDVTSAIAELQLFIKEEPSGPRAESARKELALVQAVPH